MVKEPHYKVRFLLQKLISYAVCPQIISVTLNQKEMHKRVIIKSQVHRCTTWDPEEIYF